MKPVCDFTCGIFDKSIKFKNQKKTFLRRLCGYELELIVEGEGETLIDDRAHRLAPGIFICARPGQTRVSRLEKFRCYYIHCTLPEDSEYHEMLCAAPNVFRLIDAERYRAIFEDLISHELRHPEGMDPDYLAAKMLELFYYIRRDSARNRQLPAQYAETAEPCIGQAIHYMKENYGSPMHLRDIAAHVGYSPNYFHHVFTAVMGITPQKYLTDIRIRRAKEALIRTQSSIADIAADCGFSSKSYFDLQFRRIVLLSPHQYRSLHADRYGARPHDGLREEMGATKYIRKGNRHE